MESPTVRSSSRRYSRSTNPYTPPAAPDKRGPQLGTLLMLGLACSETFAQDASSAAPSGQPLVPIEEIIVTAQKRMEREQDVPIAMTAMSSARIRAANVISILDLTEVDPSVSLETGQSFQRNSLEIRGIGTIGNTRSFEGAVGVFIDGIYRPRTGMALSDMLDIGRVEILRGPQGTLFGKNTVAGAVSLWSTEPRPDALGGFLDVRLGDFDTRYAAGAVNVPIGDSKGALRFAAAYHERDGFFESPDNGDRYDSVDRHGVKAQLLLRPTDNLEVLLIGDRARSDADCCWSAALVTEGPTAPLIETYGALNGLTFVPPPRAELSRLESLNTSPREKIEDEGVTARIVWNTDAATVTSRTGVRSWSHAQINADADFSPADLFRLDEPAEIDYWSQEVDIALSRERTDLLLGLYYESEDYDSNRSVKTGTDADNYLNALTSASLGAAQCLPPLAAVDCVFPVGIGALLPHGELTRERYEQDSRGRAIFGHSSTMLSERFTLNLGLRYSIQTKAGGVDNQFWYDTPFVRAALAAQGVPDDGTPRNGLDLIGTLYSPSFRADYRNETTTGMLSLQYFARGDVMAYASYQRGYKEGGVNLFREGAITTTTYQPEFADSVELGVKTQYWQGRARTNAALFHTSFTDLQINFFTGLDFKTENTGEATTRGLEIENVVQFSPALRAALSVTRLDSKFGDLDNPLLGYLSGRATPKAPDWAGVASVDYERALTGRLALVVRALALYSGKHYVGAEIPEEREDDAYVLTNLDVGVKGRESRWEALLWCTNCGDQSYRTILFNTTFQPGSYSAYLNAPRQVGVTFRTVF